MANENGEPQVAVIDITKIRENAVALRPVDKEKEDYQMLAASVKRNGIFNPIVVREIEDPENPGQKLYGLIDGLQRYNAAMDAGLKKIPVNIRNMDQAEVEEAQIIANVQKIETRPVQYTKQLERLMVRNPLMTVAELANRLSRTTGWLYERFGLLKLSDDIQALVDDGKIKLNNAYQLSKLPEEERVNWIDRAMASEPGEFTAAVSARKKQIAEARKEGRAAAPPDFQPVAHARKWSEIKDEYTNPSVAPGLVAAAGAKTAIEGFALAVAWAANMDPKSQEQQRAEHEAREQRKKEEKAKREAERAAKKAQEIAAAAVVA